TIASSWRPGRRWVSLITIRAKGITPAADSARVGMLTFQIGSVTVQARGSQVVVMALKSVIAGTAVEICRASGASTAVPREVTGTRAITMPTALINPVPPSQTRTESIRRANVPLIYALHKGETLNSHIVPAWHPHRRHS